MSVMRCGDVGCPCRNLPPALDDTAALRAEVERLRAVVGRVRTVCGEAERLGGGSASDYDKGGQRLAQRIMAVLDGGAAT